MTIEVHIVDAPVATETESERMARDYFAYPCKPEVINPSRVLGYIKQGTDMTKQPVFRQAIDIAV